MAVFGPNQFAGGGGSRGLLDAATPQFQQQQSPIPGGAFGGTLGGGGGFFGRSGQGGLLSRLMGQFRQPPQPQSFGPQVRPPGFPQFQPVPPPQAFPQQPQVQPIAPPQAFPQPQQPQFQPIAPPQAFPQPGLPPGVQNAPPGSIINEGFGQGQPQQFQPFGGGLTTSFVPGSTAPNPGFGFNPSGRVVPQPQQGPPGIQQVDPRQAFPQPQQPQVQRAPGGFGGFGANLGFGRAF